MNKITFTHMGEIGVNPDRAICPICGEEVSVVEMAVESSVPHLKGADIRKSDLASGTVQSTRGKAGKLSCGHEFYYDEVDHNSIHMLKEKWAYVYEIREFAEQFQRTLNDDEKNIINKVREDIENIFSLTDDDVSHHGEYFTLQYNDDEVYNKLHNHFGDVEFKFDELKFFYDIERRNPLDNPLFTVEEYESLCDEDKEDPRYIMYLEEILSRNWGELNEEGFRVPPINFWEIPEENKKETYEFTISLFKNKEA